MPSVFVPLSGVPALLGGLSILMGYKAKLGAWLLVVFLIPVTFMLHNWWVIVDPMTRQLQHVMFHKNLALLGCALLITYFGASKCSIDGWLRSRPIR